MKMSLRRKRDEEKRERKRSTEKEQRGQKPKILQRIRGPIRDEGKEGMNPKQARDHWGNAVTVTSSLL